jgi:aspartate/methionine/tyrosine aminotransferase
MEIAPYVPGRSTTDDGRKVAKLSSNENALGTSPHARAAFESAGYVVDRSHAGLYLWVRPEAGGQDSWATVADLAGLGILVAPGAFYGDAEHVRVALTASDEQIAEAAARLSGA